MEDKKQTVVRGGTSLFSVALVTTLVFFILKVTNVLAWSWVWVLSPLWIYAALAVGVFVLLLLVFLICVIASAAVKTAEKIPLLKMAAERSLFSYINTLI